MKKISVVFVFILFCVTVCYGQAEKVRHLKRQLPLIKDSLRYVDALNRLAMLMYEDDIDSTFIYTAQARNIAGRQQYAKGMADATNNLGIFYDIKGNLQLALRYYNDAYNRYKILHDTSNMVQGHMNIAQVFNEIGKDQKSIKGFKEAVSLGRKLGHDSIMALVWYNYVLMYSDRLPKDSVNLYIDKAKTIAAKYKDERVMLAIEQLVADNYVNNGERDKGVAMLQKTVNDVLKRNLYYLSLDMLIDLGDIFAKTDSARAVGYYQQALKISDDKEYRIYTQSITKKLYDFYNGKKDTATAFYYSQKLLTIREEQEKVDNSSGIDYIEYAIKDQQLDSARVQADYQQKFLVLAILICVMTIVIIIVLWRNWKQSRRTTEVLRTQFQQTETTMEALDVMNKNYARVIKIVAHDLRNPIGAIYTITTMIDDDTTPEETSEYVNLIKVSTKNCLELINELQKTDFDSQQELNIEEIDFDELLSQSIQLLSLRAKEKSQELLLNTNLGVKIHGDNEKLWRVINNLVVNAIKFSPEGSEILIDTRLLQKDILIVIKDKGIGIPIAMQSKIFDPFTTARRSGTQGEQPFGLGLYISKQIIEAHHGKIWVESEPGKGTSFYIELPV
ncbi:hypothetical protein GCM10023149_21990 [Mucilaginibacter gynuensis]|uniref:histidine kinase n=1 Tax=Mucilaginibacter gynuensis TaxID=1302236 RepID=A0ABP8GCU2_9SPHI